jgi:hypothetical protein
MAEQERNRILDEVGVNGPITEGELATSVGAAIGAASVCWESMSGTGLFDSDRARQISSELLEICVRYAESAEHGTAGTAETAETPEIRSHGSRREWVDFWKDHSNCGGDWHYIDDPSCPRVVCDCGTTGTSGTAQAEYESASVVSVANANATAGEAETGMTATAVAVTPETVSRYRATVAWYSFLSDHTPVWFMVLAAFVSLMAGLSVTIPGNWWSVTWGLPVTLGGLAYFMWKLYQKVQDCACRNDRGH